ncbi:hypothetical protein HK096_000738, partial [Nowakowskiella sp. JEL0078]
MLNISTAKSSKFGLAGSVGLNGITIREFSSTFAASYRTIKPKTPRTIARQKIKALPKSDIPKYPGNAYALFVKDHFHLNRVPSETSNQTMTRMSKEYTPALKE